MARITFEEFKQKWIEDDLFNWIVRDDQDEKSWLVGVEDWANLRWSELYEKEEREMAKFVIWPYYTGRDKGAVMTPNPNRGPGEATHLGTMKFDSEQEAWDYIFNVLQPNDERAKHNYRVLTLREYRTKS